MNGINFTCHALERMEKYNITLLNIDMAMRFGVEEQTNGGCVKYRLRQNEISRCAINDENVKPIELIFSCNGPRQIVTIYTIGD